MKQWKMKVLILSGLYEVETQADKTQNIKWNKFQCKKHDFGGCFAPEKFVKFELHAFPILWRKLEVVWTTVSYTFVAIAKHCEPPTFVQHLLEKCSFAQHEIFSDGQESSYENMCKIWRKSLWGITLKNGVKVFPCFPYWRQILPPLTTRSNGH